MATSMKPKIQYVSLDKKRPIIFDLNAFAMIEDEYPNTEAAFDAMEGGSLKALRTILTAAMASGDPAEPMTAQEVGALVTMGNMGATVATLQEALMAALPAETRAKVEAAQKEAERKAIQAAAAATTGQPADAEGEAPTPA
jgi:hypothetical protein